MPRKKKNDNIDKPITEKIIKTEYSEEMKQSFIDYSMSVIVARAIPDIRDGLKPVHRRILYTMYENGLYSDKPYKKCADTVGSVLGKYHPHGDSSVYDALVVMAQDWKKGKTLIDGHGNFGSIEGDGPAHYRYTESKLEKFSEDIFFEDLNKSTVEFIPNYDNTKLEPMVLPARIPNALINGSEGIAVGMATNTPPHNLKEILEGYKLYLDDSNVSLEKVLKIVKGPDFPTGGIIANASDLKDIYKTGHGKIRIRGKVEYEPAKKKSDKDLLIVSEIPYTMIGSGINKFLEDVGNLVKDKKIPEIVDILNQSSREGIRLVFELKPNSDIEKIKNILYKKTKLEDTYGVSMLFIANGRPELMGILDIYKYFLDFQIETKNKKYAALYASEKEKLEIQEGYIKAIDVIDLIIEIIRGSKTSKMAKDCLTGKSISGIKFKTKKSEGLAKKLSFTELQAQSILDMRLNKLIGMELEALMAENKRTQAKVNEYSALLKSKKKIIDIIKEETECIIKKYNTKRKTQIANVETINIDIDKIEEQDVYFVMDKFNYAKLYDTTVYDRNIETILSDNKYIISCKNTDSICIFTNIGQMHQIKCEDIPFSKMKDRGIPIDNLCNYDSNEENILNIICKAKLKNTKAIFITKKGLIKQVLLDEFITTRKVIASTKLTVDDEILVIGFVPIDQIILETHNHYFIRFKAIKIPLLKKTSMGIKALRLKPNDNVERCIFVTDEIKEFSTENKTMKVEDMTLSSLGKTPKLLK